MKNNFRREAKSCRCIVSTFAANDDPPHIVLPVHVGGGGEGVSSGESEATAGDGKNHALCEGMGMVSAVAFMQSITSLLLSLWRVLVMMGVEIRVEWQGVESVGVLLLAASMVTTKLLLLLSPTNIGSFFVFIFDTGDGDHTGEGIMG